MCQPGQQKPHPQNMRQAAQEHPRTIAKRRITKRTGSVSTLRRGEGSYLRDTKFTGLYCPHDAQGERAARNRFETALRQAPGCKALQTGRQSRLVAPREGQGVWHHLRTWLESYKRRGTVAPVPGSGSAGTSAAGLTRLKPGTSAAGLVGLGYGSSAEGVRSWAKPLEHAPAATSTVRRCGRAACS